MARLGLAVRVFFRTLKDAAFAVQVQALLAGRPQPTVSRGEPPRAAEPAKPRRSEALTLLAALEREARFVDFVQENITGYSDAQIGAAVRDVHRDCGLVLKRAFGLQPIRAEDENTEVEVPADYDAGWYRLTGKVADHPPFRGLLCHHGWLATQCVLPAWNGNERAALVVAPAVVELK